MVEPPAATINFGVNILNVPNDRAYYTGRIQTVILTEEALGAPDVAALHQSLKAPPGSQPELFDVELNAARTIGTLHFRGLQAGQTYHVLWSDGLDVFAPIPGSEFTAAGETESIQLPVDLDQDDEIFVKGAVGPIPAP